MTAKTAQASAKKTKTTKSASETAEMSPAKKGDTKSKLRMWNMWLGIALLALAIAVVVVGNSSTVPLTTQYLAKDALATEATGHEVLAPATRHLADIHISWIVAKFLVIGGVVYLLAATLLRKRYEAWIDRGVNNLRWVGFGLAGGVAVAGVAMLGGVSDLATLLSIFGSIVLASVFAAALELLGPDRRLCCLLAAGAVAGLVLPWLGFVANVAGVLKYDGSLPTYLYFVYAVITLWFIAVGAATHFRIAQRGKWADTLYAERAFMLMGFAAAVVLALQIFVGALYS